MRLISSVAALFGAVVCIACAGSAGPAAAPASAPVPAPAAALVTAPAPDDAAFDATVRPLLARTCAPCHNPGGKLYDRLPFDRAEMIRAHRDGVLRRLKGADLETVRTWLGPAQP